MSSSDKGIASDDGVASSNDNEYEIEDIHETEIKFQKVRSK